MPWDGAELMVADVAYSNGAVSPVNPVKIAGQPVTISVAQPHWVNDDVLIFTSDQSGYQNPWICDVSDPTNSAGPLFDVEVNEDFGEPAWYLGDSCYAILDEDTIIFTAMRDGRSVLYLVTLSNRTRTELPCPFVHVSRLRKISTTQVAFLGESDFDPVAIVVCTLNGASVPEYEVVKSSGSGNLADLVPYFATPQSKSFTNEQDQTVYMVYYSPTNPDFIAPPQEKPPLVVYVHGGPTSLTTQGLSLKQQYFTSRGYAWVNVNYGGSSGYGRKYMWVVIPSILSSD